MQEFVTRMNIQRFQKLISEGPDAATRASLERMLADEQAKLRAFRDDRVSAGSQDSAIDDGSGRQQA